MITQPRTRPKYLPWVTYANTDTADLVSHPASTQYVIQEYGQDKIFRLRSAVGAAVRLVNSPTAPWGNVIFLYCTRASNKHPNLHEDILLCLTNLIHQLHRNHTTRIHLIDQLATTLVYHATRPLHGSESRNSSPRPSLRL